jgi:hypothetical protein
MSNFMSLTTIIAGVLFAALVGSLPARAEESYPWCLHGTPQHCYYMNRWQCEESADFRGICELNLFNQKSEAPLR